MSSLYLFRHGQAGLRDNYDTLSEKGRAQIALLGGYWARRQVRFQALITGQLTRQMESARQVSEACRQAGGEMPDAIADPHWNEFDLSAVYAGIAPQLAAEDPRFRSEFEMLEQEAANAESAVHRRWTASDVAVVRAWVEGRYRHDGESWNEFRQRVAGAMDRLRQYGPGEAIAVSTSATPIAVWMGLALNLESRYVMRLAGVLYNASFTSFRLKQGELTLFSFNNVPHLEDPGLRTLR